MGQLLPFAAELRRVRDGRGGPALDSASSEDVAWLAGLLEGEVSFTNYSYSKGKRYTYPCISLVSTDRDVVERAAGLMGSTVRLVKRGPKADPKWKPAFITVLVGWPAVDVMTAVRPWMGERRGAKIDELVSAYTARRRPDGKAKYCGKGHEFTPENTYVSPKGKRRCIICHRSWRSGRRSAVA